MTKLMLPPVEADHSYSVLRMLPAPNRDLTRLARAAAFAATPLLAPGRLPLLGITLERDEKLILTWWDHRFATCGQIEATPAAFAARDTAEGALQHAGVSLIRHLAGRWPVDAGPTRLGVVTDGTGVMFSPEHPCPLAPNWLLRHGSGAAQALAIVAFDPASDPLAPFIRVSQSIN